MRGHAIEGQLQDGKVSVSQVASRVRVIMHLPLSLGSYHPTWALRLFNGVAIHEMRRQSLRLCRRPRSRNLL